MYKLIFSLVILMLVEVPVINPDNVRPGSWFIPTNAAQREADRQYHCRVLFERTGLICENRSE